MRSIKSKTILLSVIGISTAIGIATTIGAVSLARLGHRDAEKILALSCDSGKHSLNSYFYSIERTTNTVSSFIDADLDTVSDSDFNSTNFSSHMTRARDLFARAVKNTSGVYTYYYRIDPSITAINGETGFWYTNLDGQGFKEHEVTDLNDRSKDCLWFYMTKQNDGATWLNPYLTDSLDNEYVVSYNIPVKRNGQFVGVAGIEMSYRTIGEKIKDIVVGNTGFAFVIDSKSGSIIYHPEYDLSGTVEEERPTMPAEFFTQFKEGIKHIEYTFNGVKKHASAADLGNGMTIVVAVPVSEVNAAWINLIIMIVSVGVGLIAAFVVVSIIYSSKMTKPLKQLTKAAEEINNGNYKVKLEKATDDEIGVLTTTVDKLTKNLGAYINDLNKLAYADSITEVKNKKAFDEAVEELEKLVEDPERNVEFAIAILDCDDLKGINDNYGHDKGDVYLRNSCNLIRRVFEKSTVYRLGGDEFGIILQGQDYENRESLMTYFFARSKEICAFAKEPWENIRVSIGIATYEKDIDKSVHDVIVHADRLMYVNKRERKQHN